MATIDDVAAAARKRPYDSRLDSGDVVERQQAEIEALRTCLIASNSDSCDEYARLQAEIERLKASYAGQLRNTHAFQADASSAKRALSNVVEWWEGLPSTLRQDIEGSGGFPGCIAAARRLSDGGNHE